MNISTRVEQQNILETYLQEYYNKRYQKHICKSTTTKDIRNTYVRVLQQKISETYPQEYYNKRYQKHIHKSTTTKDIRNIYARVLQQKIHETTNLLLYIRYRHSDNDP